MVDFAKSPFLRVETAYTASAMDFTTSLAIDHVTTFLEFTNLIGRKWHLSVVLISISIVSEVVHLSYDCKSHLFLWIVALFFSHGFLGALYVLGKQTLCFNLQTLFVRFCHLSFNFGFYQAEVFDVCVVIFTSLLWFLDFES